MTNDRITPQYVVAYFKDVFSIEDPKIENIEKTLNAMKKYKDNLWWESDDKAIKAFYQTFEKILIIPMKDFHGGLSELLGRRVYFPNYLMIDDKIMKKEVMMAKKDLEKRRLEKLEKSIFSTRKKLKDLESGYKRYLKTAKVPELSKKYGISQRKAYKYCLEEKEIFEHATDYCTILGVRSKSQTEKEKLNNLTNTLINKVGEKEYIKYRISNPSRKDYLLKKLEILVTIEDYESATITGDKIKKLK